MAPPKKIADEKSTNINTTKNTKVRDKKRGYNLAIIKAKDADRGIITYA